MIRLSVGFLAAASVIAQEGGEPPVDRTSFMDAMTGVGEQMADGMGGGGGEEQGMTFQPPEFTEEEEHGQNIPKHFRCDGCIIAAHAMASSITTMETHKGSPLRESYLDESVERGCRSKSYNEIGVKGFDGKKDMVHPALFDKKVAGMIAGGGRWPGRVIQQCLEVVGDLEEEGVYDLHVKAKKTGAGDVIKYWENFVGNFCSSLCKDGDLTNYNPETIQRDLAKPQKKKKKRRVKKKAEL